MAGSKLKLEHLAKHFGRFKAVDDLSLEIGEGEVFTLLGPSGCGKTTTLRLIAGLESPDGGNIFFGDRTIVSVDTGIFVPTHKRNLGMVFQSYAIWPHLTVFENVAYPLKVRRVKGNLIRSRVLQSLELVGLGGKENRPAPLLSGGEQQRVALARALVYEPSIFLLDEPFSNLDAKLRKEMRVQLKLLLKKLKITTVFVTHDQVEALSLSDRIGVMRAGRVEQVSVPRELYEQPRTAFVRDFLGSTVLLKGRLSNSESSKRASVHLAGLVDSCLYVKCPSEFDSIKTSNVLVAIRPEDIALAPPRGTEPEPGCLWGVIESLLFVGDRYECRVRLSNDETLFLNTPRSLQMREGETVELRMSEEGISVWPA